MKGIKSVMSILSFCAKKWKAVLLGLLVGAILLGGFQGYRKVKERISYNQETSMAQYEEKLHEYEQLCDSLENSIAQTRSVVEATEKYLNESILMRMDPSNFYITTLDLVVVLQDAEDLVVVGETDVIPEGYMTEKIQNLYRSIWDTMDLCKASGVEADKYLREVLDVEARTGGVIRIKSRAETYEVAQKLAESVRDYFWEHEQEVQAVSFLHELKQLSMVTNERFDEEIYKVQKEQAELLESQICLLADLEIEQTSLQQPTKPSRISVASMAKAVFKYAIIGGFLGAILVILYCAMICAFSDVVISSAEIVESCNITCLGSMAKKGAIWSKWTSRIAGDFIWNSNEDAIQYIERGIALDHSGKEILFLSTNTDNDTELVGQEFVDYFNEKGYSASLVVNALRNPKLYDELERRNKVVLLEHSCTTKVTSVEKVLELTEKTGKELVGFVLIH